jgi:hypothetical protein
MSQFNLIVKQLKLGELSKLNLLFSRISGVKSGRGWINWFNKLVDLILVGKKPSWTRATFVFTKAAFTLLARSGRPGLVLYLKACNVLLMQAAGGMRIRDTRPLKAAVSRSADGLPRIIPRVHRGLIRRGDQKTIRIWMSLFALYRVLEYPSSASLRSITDPGVSFNLDKFRPLAIEFGRSLGFKKPGDLRGKLSSPVKAMLVKSSPATAGLPKEDKEFKYSSSWLGVQQGAVSLYAHSVWNSFQEFYTLVTPPHEMADRYWNYVKRIEGIALAAQGTLEPGLIGRLGFKQEAAGKVRVFAMVDAWTQ